MEDTQENSFTVKAIGHQWYWSYEYSGQTGRLEKEVRFRSYLAHDTHMTEPRLLGVDNRMLSPYRGPVRLLVTRSDVIHS